MPFVYTGPNQLNRVWVDDAPKTTAAGAHTHTLTTNYMSLAELDCAPPSIVAWHHNTRMRLLDRVETLSAAHRLLGQLADDTLSRETQAECRDVMAKLERIVEEG